MTKKNLKSQAVILRYKYLRSPFIPTHKREKYKKYPYCCSVAMASLSFCNICILLLMVMASASGAHSLCEGQDLSRQIQRINSLFPSVGLILQSDSQLKAFLQSSTPFPYLNTSSQIDISGRRFHVRFFASHIVVMVSAGTGMLNAGTTAELMLAHFPGLKVVHYGKAGNADSNLNTGDIVVPRQWAHTGLWEWQRNGEEKKLGVASLKFADYNSESVDNDLYRVWFQSEEVYTTPEAAKHVFWVNVSENYYAVTEKLTQVELDSCAESDMSTSVGKPSSCLSYTPKVVRVERGSSANIYVDNVAYRKFLRKTFDITAIDEDSAAIALVCERLKKPFVSFRTLSDLAGAGSSENEEAAIAYKIANKNGVKAVSEFVKLLPSPRMESASTFAI